ncbi:hypothetical protein [Burkholderia singularis]|nr:hypothetical protein [Burkholderia singularis]
MPHTPSTRSSSVSITSGSKDSQSNVSIESLDRQSRVVTRSLSFSPELDALSSSPRRQRTLSSEERTISPLTEIDLDLAAPFSNLNPLEGENFIRDIMIGNHSDQEKRPGTPYSATSIERIQAWLESKTTHLDPLLEFSSFSSSDFINTQNKYENITQPLPSSSVASKKTPSREKSKKNEPIKLNPISAVTPEILCLAAESVGTGPGKISRNRFELLHGLSNKILQGYINIDGTLTSRGQRRLTHSPQSQVITVEILEKAEAMLKDVRKTFSEVAYAVGARPHQLRRYIKNRSISLIGKQFISKQRKISELQPITENLIKLAVQNIGTTYGKMRFSEFARIHNVSFISLRKHITAQGILTEKGKKRLAKAPFSKYEKSQKIIEIETAASHLAKLGQWNFCHDDLLFAQSFKILSQVLNIKFDVETPEYTHSIGSDNAPHAGSLILKQNHYSVQIGGSRYDPPPDGDCAFHALNILSIYNKEGGFGDYIAGPQRTDGTIPLILPSDDIMIKSTIRKLRYIAASYVIRNANEISLAIPDKQASESGERISPFSRPPQSLDIKATLPTSLPESEASVSYISYLSVLDEWSHPSELDPTTSSIYPHSPSVSASGLQTRYPKKGFPISQHQKAEFTQSKYTEAVLRDNLEEAISTKKHQKFKKYARLITPQLLKLAQQAIIDRPGKLSEFLKKYQLNKRTLLHYISNKGLTLAGEQLLEEKESKPVTPELIRLASQTIGTGGIMTSRRDFAQIHGISILVLNRLVRANGTLTPQGQRYIKKNKPLPQEDTSLLLEIKSKSEITKERKISVIKKSVSKLIKLGKWNFPHADLLFANSLKTFAFDNNMQFDVQTPDYSHRIGQPNAPYVGTLILQHDHYNVQIGDDRYDVPPDGDCAFHALNILRLYRDRQNLGDYVVGRPRPDGVIPLSIPIHDEAIRSAIKQTRTKAAEHVLQHIDEIAEAMTEE